MRRFLSSIACTVLALAAAGAQTPPDAAPPTCTVEAWTSCDLLFELSEAEDTDRTELRIEFRSPRRDTLAIRGFRQAPGQWIIRVAPHEVGQWDYRITSSVDRLNGQLGQVTATEPTTPFRAAGFLQTANLHHFQTQGDLLQHLWMATEVDDFVSMPRAAFDQEIAARAGEKFTHIRVTIDPETDLAEAANRIRAINEQALIADVVIPPPTGPRRTHEDQIAEMVARFGAFHITWGGIPEFENLEDGWSLAREVAQALATTDPYRHPVTSQATGTSASLLGADVPLDMLSYGTADPHVGAVEHQFYQLPQLAAKLTSRSDLWNATMNGQYPASSYASAGQAAEFTHWFDLISESRYWELEPYFDLDGGRAVALEGVEYLVYVSDPGPMEMRVEKHGYDVLWLDPSTGERIEGKGFNEERFLGEPPPGDHDWVLRVSREGRKEDMLKSFKYESRDVPLVQQVEIRAEETPFAVAAPEGQMSLSVPAFYELEITRPSRATRDLLVLWTAEAASSQGGFRVVGTGTSGTIRLPEILQQTVPTVLSLRVSILNAFGKAYSIDRAVRLNR